MRRFLPLLVLSSCGLFGMSAEDAGALARYQRNAQTYYGNGNFRQALSQVDRGLEIDPNDYKLRTVQAWCVLRKSQQDPRLLADAVAKFNALMSLRDASDDGPQARLGYSTAHSKMGLELRRAAEDARRRSGVQLATTTEAADAAAAALETKAQLHFDNAERELSRLVETGDYLLESHFQLMQTRAWRGDYDGAVSQGQQYLARVEVLQDELRRQLAMTLQIDYERELRIRLNNRLQEETQVRAFLANLHYKNHHHELVVDQLDAVLAVNPQLYREYYNRGRSLVALGRREEAVRDLEKFVAMERLNSDSPQIQQALDLLRQLQ